MERYDTKPAGQILAIDPSFRGTGLCRVDIDSRRVDIQIIRGPQKTREERDFGAHYMAALDICNDLQAWILSAPSQPSAVISEVPPPVGMYSAGLFLLDAMIINRLTRLPLPPKVVMTMNPSWLGFLFSKRSVAQRQLTDLGMSLLSVFAPEYKVSMRRKRLCNDEGVAVALAARLYARLFPADTRTKEIVRLCPRMYAVKEKTLWGTEAEGKGAEERQEDEANG